MPQRGSIGKWEMPGIHGTSDGCCVANRHALSAFGWYFDGWSISPILVLQTSRYAAKAKANERLMILGYPTYVPCSVTPIVEKWCQQVLAVTSPWASWDSHIAEFRGRCVDLVNLSAGRVKDFSPSSSFCRFWYTYCNVGDPPISIFSVQISTSHSKSGKL
jgi:hypothetical protein